jgi:hypothetical protein
VFVIKTNLIKASEFLRKEARTALPAAGRAATHGMREFLKRLPDEYAKERKRR